MREVYEVQPQFLLWKLICPFSRTRHAKAHSNHRFEILRFAVAAAILSAYRNGAISEPRSIVLSPYFAVLLRNLCL